MPKLGVNIDHVATLRQARREFDPDPILAAEVALKSGADSIVCHLREDRRHIQDADVMALRKFVRKNFTLELSLANKIVQFAYRIKPDTAVFVPEKRSEITTEGGLDVVKFSKSIQRAILLLKKKDIKISLFIDPSKKQINAASKLDADYIELHTGCYANAASAKKKKSELKKLKEMTQYAHQKGLIVNAGHGLKYHDTLAVAKIKNMHELNIGHSIISEAMFTGLSKAVKSMKKIVSTA